MSALRLKYLLPASAQRVLSLIQNASLCARATFALLAMLSISPALVWAAPAATLTSAAPSANFGSAQVGTNSATNVTLTFTFSSSGSISAPVVLTQGAANLDFTDAGSGTCTTNGTGHVYSVNDTCTIVANFKPTAVGLRMGAVQLYSAGTLVVTAPVEGVGTGPLAQFPAGGTQSQLGSGFSLPGAVAVDGAGDVFLADLALTTGSIVEITAGGTVQTLVTGLPNPSFGLAVDGAGNVYYSDFGNQAIKEIVATNGVVSPSSTVIAVGPTITAPEGIAVDGLGNLFVANGLNVYEIAAVNGAPGSTAITVGSGWTAPLDVAMDASGNLFVVDGGDILTPNSGTVKKVVAAGGAFNTNSIVTTVAQNLNSPGGLVVDAGGNLYVAATGDGVLKEFIATGGVVDTSSVSQTLGSGFNGPNYVATDGKGNLWVSDGSLTSIVKLSLTDAPSLSFASTAVGSTSSDSPQKVTLQNAGNDTMSLTVPNPTTTSFVLDNSATSCGTTMQASSTCTIGIDFTPKATGSLSDSVVVADNSLDVSNATQSISLSGTGTPGATATATVAGSAIATFDPASQTVSLSAVVTAGGTAVTTGTVTFTVMNGSTTIGSAVTSGTLSSSGAASVSYTIPAGTAAGSYTIQAVYNAGSGFATSSDSTHQLVIGKAMPVVSTAPTATAITYGQTLASSTLSGGAASYNSVAVSGSFVFTSPSTAPNAGTPSETVTFTPTDSTDYNSVTSSVIVTVHQAAATVAVTGYTVAYDGSAHTATGAATGIGGANLFADLTFSGTTHTNAGVYTDSWSFTDPAGNYAPQTGTVTDTIQQIPATIAFSSTPPAIAYQGGSITPTLTYNGDGTASAVSQTPAVCTVSAGVVNFVGGGTCTITPSATAGVNYATATGSAQSFWVGPTQAVGTATSTLTATVTITTAGTAGQINVLTQGAANKDYAYVSGGTCATGAAYIANQTCTVQLTFTPSRPGQRLGAVSLTTGPSGSDTVLGTALIYGIGNGPLAAFPGSTSIASLGSGFKALGAVAVDGSGNVYVADSNSMITEIVAANGVISSSPTILTLGSGFNQPGGVAVDGSGNVYVADTGNSMIKEIVAVNGVISSSPTILTLGSGFNQPLGVAVDSSGNVYVADSGNSMIKEIVAVNGVIPSSPTIRTLANGSSSLAGVALDGKGNVYFADESQSVVGEIVAVNGVIPSSPALLTLGSGFNAPTGVAVDSGGNVYVADYGNNVVKEIGAINGVVPSNPTILTLGSGFRAPNSIALDGRGNVYVVDYGHYLIKEIDLAQPPALNFASTSVTATSSDSPQSVMVQNDGDLPLTFSSIGLTANPSNFAIGGAGTCSTSAPLAESGTCNVSVSFSPTVVGSPDTDTLTLADNSLNTTSATQSIALSGTATPAAATTTKAGAATATYSPSSQSVALTATVTAGTSAATAGTVTFTLLNGTKPVGSAITSGTLNSSGVDSVNYALPAGTAAGTYTIQAVFNGGAGYIGSSDSSQLLTVNQVTLDSITPPTASAITYGQTLANSTLTGGAAHSGSTPVAGSFAFTKPATVPDVGVQSETVTFTPTDAADYTTATATISITVNKATPTLTLTGIPPGALVGESFTADAYNSADDYTTLKVTSQTPGVCAVGPGALFAPGVDLNSIGTCTLVASAQATARYNAVTISQSFEVGDYTFNLTGVCTKNHQCVAPDKTNILNSSAGEPYPLTLEFTLTPLGGFSHPVSISASDLSAGPSTAVAIDCVSSSGAPLSTKCDYSGFSAPTKIYIAVYKSGSPSTIVTPQMKSMRTKVAGVSFVGALLMLVCTCFGRWQKFARNLVKIGAMIVLVISLGGWAGGCPVITGTSSGTVQSVSVTATIPATPQDPYVQLVPSKYQMLYVKGQ